MLQMIISYFSNLRVIQKNMAAASQFPPEDRAFVAEQLFTNQRLIALIEAGGLEEAPLDDVAIQDLLVQSFHNCTKMGAQATTLGGRSRRDPFLNLASTLQGLYTETLVARHRPSHKKFLDQINLTVGEFAKSNLTNTKCAELDADLRKTFRNMTQSLRSQ